MTRDGVMFYSLRVGMWLAAVLPPRVGYGIASAVGIALYFSLASARRGVRANMRHVLGPKASQRKINVTSRKVFRNAVKNYYDLLRLPKLSAADISRMVTVSGAEYIDEALKQKRGVLIVGGHIANFNLMMQAAAARNYKTSVVAERLSSAKMDEMVNGLRERFGIEIIPTGPHVVRGIYKSLRANEVLGLAMDRDITHNGLPVELFGAPAVLPAGPVQLHLRLRAPIIPIRVRREANNNTSVQVFPPLELERTGDSERDMQLGMEKMARLLESFVSAAPEQWVVTQPIWAEDGGVPLPKPGFAEFDRAQELRASSRELPAPGDAESRPTLS